MRIIGGKDYYDSAAMYGIDNSVVFVRNPSVFPVHPFNDKILSDHSRFLDRKVYLFTVAVGGKVYPGACKIFENASTRYRYTKEFFYTEAELLDALPDNFLNYGNWYGGSVKNNIHNHFNTDPNAHIKWLINNEIVVGNSFSNIEQKELVYFSKYNKKYSFYANHFELGKLEFYKCLDAVTTHMEISRFVGGILPFSKPTLEISDKSKIVKAGFDVKESFRKRKI